MWCVVKVNQVVQLIPRARAVVINEVQHPAAIFSSWTSTELANIGVFLIPSRLKIPSIMCTVVSDLILNRIM